MKWLYTLVAALLAALVVGWLAMREWPTTADGVGLPRDRGAPVVYAALGDSTVYGAGATRPENAYVGRIGSRLRDVYPQARATNLGVNGATAADVVAGQLDRAVALRPNLVTLSVGPNDILRGRSAEAYERDMTTIFRRLSQETGALVVVNLLPDLSVAPRLPPDVRALAGAITARYNDALRRAAQPHRVVVVDLYIASQREVPGNPALLSADYFHPSDEGYARWAEVMWRGIAPAIPAEE
jgi:acyl-CoA thioesterase I